jgi:hypothetical protein
MGYIEEVSCDICGKVKGATNHWFLASKPEHPLTISIVILPFSKQEVKDSSYTRDVICGEGCLHKWISLHSVELHGVRPVGEDSLLECTDEVPMRSVIDTANRTYEKWLNNPTEPETELEKEANRSRAYREAENSEYGGPRL